MENRLESELSLSRSSKENDTLKCYSCQTELQRGEYTIRNLFSFERQYLNLNQNYVVLCKKNRTCHSFYEKKYKEAVEYEQYKSDDLKRRQQNDL